MSLFHTDMAIVFGPTLVSKVVRILYEASVVLHSRGTNSYSLGGPLTFFPFLSIKVRASLSFFS